MKKLCVTAMMVLAGMAVSAPVSMAVAAVDPEAATYRSLVEKKGPAIVTIKYVLKTAAGGGEDEEETEVPGFLISEDGLVMTSNMVMGGMPEAWKQQMGGRGGANRTPKDIKVLAGDDNEGVEAKLIARDSELDLAWIQITKPAKKYSFVDITMGGKVELGDKLVVVERLGKFNDREISVNESRVRAMVKKPRALALPGQELASSVGMPVFTVAGEFVGVSVLQLPSPEEMQAESGGMLGRTRMSSMMGGVVLPADDVVKATEKGKEAAKSGKPVDEEPAAKPEGDKDGDKPATDKPPVDKPATDKPGAGDKPKIEPK